MSFDQVPQKNNPLPTCDPQRLCPIASSRAPPFTPCRAIHHNARFASFYDARIDQLIDHSTAPLPMKSLSANYDVSCFINRPTSEDGLNLMKAINMHHELSLSVALKITPATGKAAIINYSHPINHKYTRIFSYSILTRTEYLPDTHLKRLFQKKQPLKDIYGTHVIIFINYGIDARIILQLPQHDDQLITHIDHLLTKIGHALQYGRNPTLAEDEERVLRNITHTQVFSNIPSLPQCPSIIDFSRMINTVRNQTDLHQPYNYNLCPIGCLFELQDESHVLYNEISSSDSEKIQTYILLLLHQCKPLQRQAEDDYPLCRKYLGEVMRGIDEEREAINTCIAQVIQLLRDYVVSRRSGGSAPEDPTLDTLLGDSTVQKIYRRMEDLSKRLHDLSSKEHFFKQLKERRFNYRPASRYRLLDTDDESMIEQKLLGHEAQLCILCGTDHLVKENKQRWSILCNRVAQLRRTCPDLRVMYVDFSDHSYQLKELKMFSSEGKKENRDTTINVLLLGESGVGKSTFINALVNYLRFDTFQQADHNKPIVLLPISFIVTSGHDFEEHHVTYPGIDAEHHEVHDQPGQSVTQHCRSYVFTIKDEKKARKIRLIDSPGVGDVRGVDQDEKNMQEVLSYIEQLGYLHAVCIVMKPNVTRLSVDFRRCFNYMVDLLGEDARDHILFCFTNTRSTFYGPGSTGIHLRHLLQNASVKDIPFKKNNTFCFDSESFRYLVAKQKAVRFDLDEVQQYEDTWQRSSAECKRFLTSLLPKDHGFEICDDQQSLLMTTHKIHLLCRPMAEAMRLLLRNIILRGARQNHVSIKLVAKGIEDHSLKYHRCVKSSKVYGHFVILADSVDNGHEECANFHSQNGGGDSVSMQYYLEYEEVQATANETHEQFNKHLDDVLESSVVLGCFLMHEKNESTADRMGGELDKMIREEEYICRHATEATLNVVLAEKLTGLRRRYDDAVKSRMKKMNKQEVSSMVFRNMDRIREDGMIRCQMEAVQTWERSWMRRSEFEVPLEVTLGL